MKNILIITLLVGLTLMGCNDFLDKNPDPTKRVPISLDDVDRLSNYSRNIGSEGWDGGTDEFFIPVFNARFSEEGRNFYKTWNFGELTPWTMLNFEITDRSYKAIQNANASLEVLATIKHNPLEQQLYNKIKAKCHYLRAINYMFLAWTYCKAYDPETARTNLGMPIDESSYFADNLTRSTLEELYQYILKEAELAYNLFELRYPLRDELNKINAIALLARIHLSMRQYEKAFTYSNELLKHESQLMDFNNSNEVTIGSATPFQNYNREMLEIIPVGSRSAYDPVISANYNDNFIDTNLIASYSEDDLRKHAYYKKVGEYYKKNGSIYGASGDANHIMMVDEFYLVRAECYARKGDKDKALKDLNDLLVTRFRTGTFTPYVAVSPKEALDIILEERKKTLVLRGLRWMDIKRLNLEGRNIAITRKVDGVSYILPPNDPRFARPLHSVLVGDYGYEQNPY